MELIQGQLIQKPNKQELSSLFMTHRLNVMHAPVKFHKNIPYGLGVMARTQFYYMELSQRQIIQKMNKQELSSLFMTHCLNVMHAPVKFHKYIPYGLGVMARYELGCTYIWTYVRMGQTGVTLNALPLFFE